jgi:hypothetical protein
VSQRLSLPCPSLCAVALSGEASMILNIFDRRKRPYRWKRFNAIVEATSHDNSKSDTDQAEGSPDDIVYDQREGVSLEDAIAWANSLPGGVTLFLYDEGRGTT